MAEQVELTRTLLRDIHSALIAGNRAFVSVKKLEWRLVGEKWHFTILWENGGNTPAKRRSSQIASGAFEKRPPTDFEFPDLGDMVTDGGTIGPRGIRHSVTEIPFEVLETAQKGDLPVYIWGWTDYNDVFSGTERHRTEFCLEIGVLGDVRSETCQFSLAQYGRFNGLDEECIREPLPYFRGECYKFLDTNDIDKVLRDGTIKISSATYFRELEAAGGWGAIADPLEAASSLSMREGLVITENSPELDLVNKANIGFGLFQQFANVSGGGSIVIHPGLQIVHTVPEVFIYSTAFGEIRELTNAMCVDAKKPYDACLKIVDLATLRARIFETGWILGLDRKVSDFFEPGVIQPIRYELRSRDIREGPAIEPSPFKKALRYKPQSEVRLLLIPKDEAQTPKEPLIIKISDPTSLFEEVFRNFRTESRLK